jgi:hypothetical protein
MRMRFTNSEVKTNGEAKIKVKRIGNTYTLAVKSEGLITALISDEN